MDVYMHVLLLDMKVYYISINYVGGLGGGIYIIYIIYNGHGHGRTDGWTHGQTHRSKKGL